MESRSYFFIDGSHLFSSIFTIWRKKSRFNKKKLNVGVLSRALTNKWSFNVGPVVRVVYYFKKDDARIKRMLVVPKSDQPGEKNHWQIEECAESLKSIPESYLQKIPQRYRDQYQRTEKGLDIKMACDSLILVAAEKASSVVFLVNDRDYIPLFKAIQYLGGNVYLTGLDSTQKPQKGLTALADKYLTLDDELDSIFGITEQAQATQVAQPEQQL